MRVSGFALSCLSVFPINEALPLQRKRAALRFVTG